MNVFLIILGTGRQYADLGNTHSPQLQYDSQSIKLVCSRQSDAVRNCLADWLARLAAFEKRTAGVDSQPVSHRLPFRQESVVWVHLIRRLSAIIV